MATTEHRAGGYVDRDDGKGWVLDDAPPKLAVEVRPHAQQSQDGQTKAGGWLLEPDDDKKPKAEQLPAIQPLRAQQQEAARSAKAEPKPNKAKPAATRKRR